LPFLLLRREWRGYLVWFLPMLAVLVVSQVYAFQPFEYDNLKLIYYVYVMGALFLAFLMGVAFRAAPWSLVLTVPLVLAIAIPGALAIRHEFQLHDQFASAADQELAEWVRTSTDPGDVFLTTDRVAQPIATLGGRSIVMGYRGWLYNFAIPYADREAAVTAAFQGRIDDPAVTALAPDYLAVATYEDPAFPVDPAALASLPVAYQNAEWTVYALSP
jgi:hypothetical protein